VYDPQQQVALIQEAVDPVAAALPEAVPTNDANLRELGETFVPQLFTRVALVAPLIKDSSFFEEREWRMVWMPSAENITRVEYRAGRAMLIPYVPIRLGAAGSAIPIGEIIIGPTPHQYLAMNALTGFLQRYSIPWQAVRPSQIPYRQL